MNYAALSFEVQKTMWLALTNKIQAEIMHFALLKPIKTQVLPHCIPIQISNAQEVETLPVCKPNWKQYETEPQQPKWTCGM